MDVALLAEVVVVVVQLFAKLDVVVGGGGEKTALACWRFLGQLPLLVEFLEWVVDVDFAGW